MEYVELKRVKTLLSKRKSSDSSSAPSVAMCEWPGGWILVFYLQNEKYVLRIRHEPRPRIFRNASIGLSVARELGFTFVTTVLTPPTSDTNQED
jgi:hypothetical protein